MLPDCEATQVSSAAAKEVVLKVDGQTETLHVDDPGMPLRDTVSAAAGRKSSLWKD